jgi:hypothetical protein
MRKAVWIWVVVAFVAGLLPGAGAALWLRSGWVAARSQLVSRNSQLHAENQALQTRLDGAEASVTALSAKVSQTPPTGVESSAAGTTSASGTPTGPPNIAERAVSPAQPTPGAKLTLSAKLTGHAEKVNMRITGPGGFDKTYFLARVQSSGTGEVWESTTKAPSTPGTYKYYAIAYAGGAKYPMPGTDFAFVVK